MTSPADLPQHRDPEQPAGGCRYWRKKIYDSRKLAREGAQALRISIELRGGHFDMLYPYPCPDGDHWHLSHYRQGEAQCSHCGQNSRAWRGGSDYWVIGEHSLENDQPCPGERSRVYDPEKQPGDSGSTQGSEVGQHQNNTPKENGSWHKETHHSSTST